VSLEVIIVDDKSTDNSLAIAREYWQKFEDQKNKQIADTVAWAKQSGWSEERTAKAIVHFRNRIKIVEQTQNMGLPFARNAGINACSSKNGHDLILPLDADDWIDPDYLKKTVPLMMNGEKVGVVGTWASVFGIKDYIWKTFTPTIESLMHDNSVPVCSLIRRSALEVTQNYYNMQLNSGYEDWNLWLDILKRGWKIEILPDPIFHYREKKESMLTDATRRRPELLKKIHSLHPDLWPPEGYHDMRNKWEGIREATGANSAGFYGVEETYKKAADFLEGSVEDWGCGKAYFRNFCRGTYKGVDGTPDGCDSVVDLARYTSNTDGILLRHVLEHNFDWLKILKNALTSAKRIAIIVCTPFVDTTKLLYIDEWGIPIFSFKKEDLTQHFGDYTEEVVTGEGQGQQCSETIFYVRTK